MRLLIAIGVFMLSLALMLVGVFFRIPAATMSASINFESSNHFTYIPPSALTRYEGTPKVTVTGTEHALIAEGRDSDVLGWIDASSFTTLDFDKSKKLTAVSSFGSGSDASPVGSDLWRASTGLSSSPTVSLSVNVANSAGVLIAADGFTAAPNKVKITWLVKHELWPSNLFLIIGFLTLLAAFTLNILAMRDMRRRRGPSRKVPKAPQGPRSRVKNPRIAPTRGRRAVRKVAISLPIGILSMSLLTGCVATPGVEATPTPTETGAITFPPVVLPAQLSRILGDIESVAATADKSKNKADLVSRFVGPAFEMRSAHYILERASKTVKALPAVSAKPITFNLPEATLGFDQPRVIMVVTESKAKGKAAVPQLLVLRQENARSNYKIWYTILLQSGAQIPSSAAAEVGAIPVAADAKYLTVSPVALPTSYGDLIDNMGSSQFAKLFDYSDDAFYTESSSYQEAQRINLKNGKITFKHTLGDKEPISLATLDGGALVAVYMIDNYLIKPTKSGSAITVSGEEKLMLGANGAVTGLRTKYGAMLLMYVPTIGSEKLIKVLGFTHGLLSVGSL